MSTPILERYAVPDHLREGAWISSLEEYKRLYARSVEAPEEFWKEAAERWLTWSRPFDRVCESDFANGHNTWFIGGQLNASVNCLDRHLETRGEQVAIIAEGDEPGHVRKLTYRELHRAVNQLANVLIRRGVRKGDRVAIYMPMIPEAAVAMLACARIGAPHSVVFAGFSAESLRDRILDSDCRVVITADEGVRGRRPIALKRTVDEAVAGCPDVHTVIVHRHRGQHVTFTKPRDIWWDEACQAERPYCPPATMDAEDLLFLLYTSGSTGKPKGVAHSTAGYLLFTSLTHRYVFDLREGDVFACMADIGWVTGHSYIVYGPLANGATTFMFEGLPTYPDAGRYWDMVQRHRITQLYTAPTALRALMRESEEHVTRYDRSSLRILGSVGEPINPEAWRWYHDVVGEGRCAVVDTFWQTETGGHMLTPFPAAIDTKPGSATVPFFGVVPVVLDEQGKELPGLNVAGVLAFKQSWPAIARTVYGDHNRFIATYFAPFPGYYFTGDGCRRDGDGYYWVTGRVDDVLNVSGHRLGTAEIESALVAHPAVAEAAVVGYPHDLKGQGIFAYVTLKSGQGDTLDLHGALRMEVRSIIGPIATPDRILITPSLPKTRSGKIMRRILRKIAAGEFEGFGDITTLADPAVVEQLIELKKAMRG